jgi:hypothetical protein
MARKTRIEFPGAFYHVLDRGDRREAIYEDDEDRRAFLGTLEEACQRTGWRVHAYVNIRGQLLKADKRFSMRRRSLAIRVASIDRDGASDPLTPRGPSPFWPFPGAAGKKANS